MAQYLIPPFPGPSFPGSPLLKTGLAVALPKLLVSYPLPTAQAWPARWHRAATSTSQQSAALFTAPKDQPENADEDERDLEPESDEKQVQLPEVDARPGADDGSSSAARGGDGTINPPFP